MIRTWPLAMLGLLLLSACAGGPVPRTQAAMANDDDDITGRCELILPDRAEGIGPCDGITLMLRSPQKKEERRARIDGYDFRFTNLNQRSYVLTVASAGYDLESNVKNELTPGQTIKIRVRAKVRPQ